MKNILDLFFIINKRYPNSIYLFLFLFISTSILETIGISLVIPIIALLLDATFLETVQNSKYEAVFPDFIFELNRAEAMIFFSVFIVVIYILKSIFIYFSIYNISLFVGRVKAHLTYKLMFNYLHQNYLYYTKKNFSEINNNINQRVNDVCDGVVQAALYIISEVTIMLGMFLLIIFFDQLNVFFIIFIFLLIGYGFAKLLNIKVSKYGVVRQKEVDVKFDIFARLISNIREILLIGKFKFAFQNFYNALYKVATLDAKRQALQRSPGLVLETVGVLSLVIIVFYLEYLNYSTTKIIATCTFFAAIAYRSIPSLHKITFYNMSYRYYKPGFSKLWSEISLKEEVIYHNEKIDFNECIELKNINFNYNNKDNDNDKKVINNLNLKIPKNKKVGIYGKSGSGKTTLLDIISGLIKPSSGELLIDNNKIDNQYLLRKLQNNISYTSQRTTILNDSFIGNICFGVEKELIDKKLCDYAIKFSKLEELEKEFNKSNIFLNDTIKNLSGGQIQRIGIARALYRDNDILIFDEATNSLDEKTAYEILNNIMNINNKTIIIVSHNLDNLKDCDYVYEFKNGNLNLEKK